MPPESNDSRLLGLCQDRRAWLLRPGLEILNRLALAPFRNRLRVDAQLPAQRRERSLRSLYCSSDGVRGRGASVTNLAHNASFHSWERIAPSNRGIKHQPGSDDVTAPRRHLMCQGGSATIHKGERSHHQSPS